MSPRVNLGILGRRPRNNRVTGEKWYDKLFNVKYLPLFHHFKAIYQFPKHIIFLVKIVANAPLSNMLFVLTTIFP
jgi:hypothetical protein